MKKNLSKSKKISNKGITLIALIITIIVLLILAGVSIATLTGENGILKQAQEAKKRTEEAQIKEEIELAYILVEGQSYISNSDLNKKAEELQEELQKDDKSATVTVDGTNLNIEYKNYETTIDKNGKLGTLAKSKIVINKFEVSGTPAETVPVPVGFYHVGGTVDEGYVISDNSADANKGVDSNELQGNQFVWIPVEKNQKVKIDVSSEEEITSIVVTDSFGDQLEIPEVNGKKYSAEVNPTINGRYKVAVTTESGETKERLIGVHSLYALDSFMDYQFTDEWAQLQWYEEEGRNFKDIQEFIEVNMGEGITVEDFLTMIGPMMKEEFQLYEEKETIDHVAKVNTNGGFYIARYEATYENGNVASKKATVETSNNATKENGMLWNYISQTDALEKAKAYNTSVSSTLPTGAAWDRVMGWLIETKEKTGFEVAIDSTSWGNYDNDTFSNTDGLIKPGQFEGTRANNIYDLAGNVWEWTTEAYGSTDRVGRGGDYLSDGYGSPASSRNDGDPANSNSNIGLRLTLFL